MSKRILSALLALLTVFCSLPALALFAGAETVTTELNVARGKSGRTGTSASVPGLTDGSVSAIAADINWNANVSSSNCWAEVDLGQAYDLASVKLVQYYSDSRYYHWVAYASNDNSAALSSWTKIAEKDNNTLSTSTGYTARVTGSVNARYVRIYGTYSSANIGFHFNEIEVYASVPFETQTWTVGSLTATLDADGVLSVSGSGAMPNYSSLTARPWNNYASMIREVRINDGVTSVGTRAFSDCSSVKTVTMAESVKTIGQYAFANCETVETLALSSAVTSLQQNAFENTVVNTVDCSKTQGDFYAQLTTVGTGNTLFWSAVWTADPVGITSGVVDGKITWSFQTDTLTLSGSGVSPELSVSTRPWKNFTSQIKKIVVGSGITEIGKNTFSRMTGIEEVRLPDGLKTLKNDAFAYCSSIDYVRIPVSLTEFYQGIFYSTTVGTVECALTYEEWKSNLTVNGPYNENIGNASWVQEGGYVRVYNLSKGILPEVSAGTNAACITDGSKTGAFWDGGVGPAEVTIDLGSGAFISSFNVTTYYGDGRYYHYEIYTSADGRNYTLAAAKNDDTPASASGEDFTMESPVYARYVNVVLTYNSKNASVHLYEVTVWGELDPDYVEPVPTEGDLDDPDNVAYGKPARAALSNDKAQRVTDGSTGTYWTGEYYPAYVDIDLLEEYELSEVIVYMPARAERYYYYTVYGSNDLASFDRLYRKRTTDPAVNEGDHIALSGVSYRFIRVYVEYCSGAGAAYLSELRVHGVPTGQNTGKLRTGTIDEILGIEDFDNTEFAAPITDAETIESVYGIIDRTVGQRYRSWFTFALAPNTVNGNDYYLLENDNGKIKITANTGVCLAAGLNYYYKYYCGVEISEQARQTRMPASVIPLEASVRRETPYKVRYAFNYCTLDYSFAFFGEEDFVRENDWLALCGVNVVLDLAGQEAVWIKFLMNFGYSFDEARDWIAGPAYYAWQFMDNLENFGGPVPDGWIVDRLNMARRTQRFKRSLGIDTVLQGYAGMIPTNFADFQDVTILKQGGWCGLARPDMIRTDGALYDTYASLFYEAQRWALGETSNYYAVDPFHEGGIRPADLSDETIAENVLESLLAYDEDAVWMVQAWWSNPTNGLLNGMGDYRQDHVIILDLTADKWNTTSYGGTTLEKTEFNGTDWVWCLLKNYGGNPSMDGRLSNLVSKIPAAYAQAEHMKGIGLISEATLDNPVVYQLLFDMAWYTEAIDLNKWIDDYAVRRYGAPSESARAAWTILLNTVYNRQGNSTQIVARVPDNVGNTYSSNNELQLEKALKLLLADFDLLCESEAYRYDLSELMRQMVNNYCNDIHREIVTAFSNSDLDAFRAAKEKFLNAFDVLNLVLGTEKDLLGGTWIGRAEDWAVHYDDFGKDSLPLSAKAIITTWAGAATAASLPDYAYRHYEGMVIDLYKARWEVFLDKQEAFLESGEEIVKLNQGDYFHIYWEWVMNTPEYTRQVQNSPAHMYAVAERVLNECSVEVKLPENVGNIAKDKPATATNEEDSPGASGGFAGNANDGSLDTYWDGGDYNNAPELVIDLGRVYDITKFNVVNYADGSRYYLYDLYVSNDGVNYVLAVSKTETTAATDGGDIFETQISGRYIKLVGRFNSANTAFHVKELRAYGTVRENDDALKGDVDGSKEVDILDVTMLLNILAGKAAATSAADVNGDSEVAIDDVSALLDLLAGKAE